MGLGPSLSIRQIQQLVLTPAAARRRSSCCSSAISSSKRLSPRSCRKTRCSRRGPATATGRASGGDFARTRTKATKRRTIPGADDLIRGQVGRRPAARRGLDGGSAGDRQLRRRRDVGSASEEAFDFDRLRIFGRLRSPSICINQLHGVSGPTASSPGSSPKTLDETGYLASRSTQIAELPARRLERGRSRRWRWCRISIRRESARDRWRNASRFRPRRPTATTRRWRG